MESTAALEQFGKTATGIRLTVRGGMLYRETRAGAGFSVERPST